MRKYLFSLTIACLLVNAPAALAASPPDSVYDRTLDRIDFFTQALLASTPVGPPPAATGSLPPLPTLALHLWLVLVTVTCLARALPRTRHLPRLQAASAARARSLIRWTIARNPFERCDDR